MLPDPLHPAVVHLPIALAILFPLVAILGIISIQKGFFRPRTWAVVVLLQLLLLGSGWMALETGEDQEERVESIVAEHHIEEHEEAAERFLILAGIGLLVGAAGLLPHRAGIFGRAAGALVSVGVLAAAVSVGHTGGELVYKHGAADAFVDAPSRNVSPVHSRHVEND